jgi:hypothetical protein
MKTSTEDNEEIIFHPDIMEWEPVFDDKIGKYLYDKKLIDDHKAGMVINFCRYPAGFYKASHTHTCSHGIYVIAQKAEFMGQGILFGTRRDRLTGTGLLTMRIVSFCSLPTGHLQLHIRNTKIELQVESPKISILS